MIMNEKIKAAEVHVTGLNGEDLGVLETREALALAKKLKVDLVCTSLYSSPPPCKLIGAGAAKQETQQARKQERAPKVKELRLTVNIEDHDYETKKQQAERILKSGDAVLAVVAVKGKEGEAARRMLEGLVKELTGISKPKTGIQVSGKQASVQLDPK
jgi:translation initiation factor IF-3